MTTSSGSHDQGGVPKLDFTTFILSISSAAFMGLGVGLEAQEGAGTSGEVRRDLELARQNIDLLELMQEKTRGNLSDEEGRLLEQLLFETRMHFVEALRVTSRTQERK